MPRRSGRLESGKRRIFPSFSRVIIIDRSECEDAAVATLTLFFVTVKSYSHFWIKSVKLCSTFLPQIVEQILSKQLDFADFFPHRLSALCHLAEFLQMMIHMFLERKHEKTNLSRNVLFCEKDLTSALLCFCPRHISPVHKREAAARRLKPQFIHTNLRLANRRSDCQQKW